jgi:hypothetical protein
MLYGAGVPVPVGVDPASDGSYFKFNLDSINLYNLIRLEASSAKAIHQSACSMLGAHTAPHQNAFFKVIDLPLSGPWAERDSQTFALLDGWLLRSRRDFTVDLQGVVPVCGDQASDPVPEIAARSQASRRGKRRQPADRPSIRAPAGATC